MADRLTYKPEFDSKISKKYIGLSEKGVIPRSPNGIPSGDAGSPIVIKAGDVGSGSGMTVLSMKYLNQRPFKRLN